jgi:hypothetical protein
MRLVDSENQLELFWLSDTKSVENRIKRLEGELILAIRRGDLQRAASLVRKQRTLLTFQIEHLI